MRKPELDLEERTELARQLHAVPDSTYQLSEAVSHRLGRAHGLFGRDFERLADQAFEPVLAELAQELFEEVLLARHGLGDHDVGLGDQRTLSASNAEIVERPLSPHPEGKGGDLRAARVDLDAVQVFAEDEPGECSAEIVEV